MSKSQQSGLGYIDRDSPIHRLCGSTKLLMTVFISIASMITYDTRYLVFFVVLAFVLFAVSKIRLRELKTVLSLIGIFLLINTLAVFLFSPEEGVKVYGTRHEIAHLFLNYYLTQEELFYLLNVCLKYFAVMPVALVFIATTEPSEFASSLNKIGVGYRAAYAVSLALRYIPDVRRDYVNINQAQQARGIDTTKKASLGKRIKNVVAILFPLLFTSLQRIDVIANAMELRGFGKNKKRTWYRARAFRPVDIAVIVGCALLIVVSVLFNYWNGGRFYNPFV